jgi:4-amino-4-deoxy-L-arabinose transferase-like glycosyltransferase
MTVSRPWLALVVLLFCLPLFVGLGRTDVGHDEAIYTFAVDRILEIGDWLTPKSSPHETEAFLEKPPLKFWIVAAPIRLGLLPHNEFGTRFWDALFGAVAFGYVFAIGSRLAGPVCGAVALLILFVHWPLLFEHGLRSNNMEAPLFLSYCGGIYHFLVWARSSSTAAPGQRAGAIGRGWIHPVAVALYFVLGFMTKFVAAIFMPMIIGVAALLFHDSRTRLVRDWRAWAAAAGVACVLIVPWFVYAYLRFGAYLWEVILTQHVYTRFRTFLNPLHVQPWSYYLTEMYYRFADSGSQWLVGAGLAVLIVQTIRRCWLEGVVVVLWFAVPVAMISLGTSKLYHYAYPFLPPLALAAGYLASLVVMLAPVLLHKALDLVRGAVSRIGAIERIVGKPNVRTVLTTIAIAAAAVAAINVLYGPIRLGVGDLMLFKSSGVVRPGIVLLVCGILAGTTRRLSRVIVVLLVLSILPIQAYRELLPRFTRQEHPMRTATNCLIRVGAQQPEHARGLYVDVPGEFVSHPLYYYFRRVRPWTRVEPPDPAAIGRGLNDPASKPMLVWDSTYQTFMNAQASRPPSPPMVALPDVVLLLPAGYASCSTNAASDGSH